MALKHVVDNLDGLPEQVHEHYTEGDDGKYHLQLDGAFIDTEDPAKLKRAKDHEKAQRQQAEQKATQLGERITAMEAELDEVRKSGGNTSALEKSYQQKIDRMKADYEGQLGGLRGSLEGLLVDNVASSVASKISTAPDVILPHIRQRLKAETGEDGKASTRVLDKNGQPSAMTVEELAQEFVANPSFSAIIIGSKGSGGGASGSGAGGGASGGAKKIDYRTSSPKEIAAHLKAQRARGG